MDRRVFITGMGSINAIGKDVKEFTASLREGKSGACFIGPEEKDAMPVKVGAMLRDFSFEAGLTEHHGINGGLISKARLCARRSPMHVQAGVLAALEAWAEAGLDTEPVEAERIGVIVAGSNTTAGLQYSLYSKFIQTPEYISPAYALQYMDTDQTAILSEVLGIKGEGFSIGGASASGNSAIVKGYQLIKMGIADVCMVVGSLTQLSPMELQAFCNLGALGAKGEVDCAQKACRPFDLGHDGFIYGQGTGCIILESMESAQHRKAVLLAELAGGALVLDGNRLSDPKEDGEARVMETAMRQAGISADMLDYINAHATSTPMGDETELRAIKRVLGKELGRVWINSTKSLTGHCLYGAGVIEAIATVIQMREGFVHPNLNLDNPIDVECRLCGTRAESAVINTAMSNSFGFGGINTSIILKKGA